MHKHPLTEPLATGAMQFGSVVDPRWQLPVRRILLLDALLHRGELWLPRLSHQRQLLLAPLLTARPHLLMLLRMLCHPPLHLPQL